MVPAKTKDRSSHMSCAGFFLALELNTPLGNVIVDSYGTAI